MPLLLILVALFGIWGLVRYFKMAPGRVVLPANATPDQIIANDAPDLTNEILDLYYNGRDPIAMDQVASELEKDGFYDAGALLHKRAAELRGNVPVPLPGGSIPPLPPQPGAPPQNPAPPPPPAPPVVVQAPNLPTQQQQPNVPIIPFVPPTANLPVFQRPQPPQVSVALRGTVTLQFQPLQMRQGPDVVSAVLKNIPPGTSVEIVATDVDPNYYPVIYEGVSGWVPKRYLSLGPAVSQFRG